MPNSTNKILSFTRAEWHGWLVIVFGFGGFLFWAAFYPMEQGVSGTGFLISQSDRVPVMAHMTGLVARLPKKLGDDVQVGDTLLEFDGEQLRATERTILQTQIGLLRSSQSLKLAMASKLEQLEALRSQYASAEKLVEAGFASSSSLATIKSQLALAESESLELQSRVEQMNSSSREIVERLASINYEKTLLKLKSPVDGQVMNMGVKSAGVNVILGNQIMEIAPKTSQLWVDARIPVEMGDRVHTGMTVNILFPTLQVGATQRFQGYLNYLSGDKITDQRTGQVYLEARIGFLTDEAPKIANLRVGLPTSVIINTGPRTLMSYILRPLTERVQRGLQ